MEKAFSKGARKTFRCGIFEHMDDPKPGPRPQWRLIGEINDMAKGEGWHLQICVDRQIVIAPDEAAPKPRHDALAYVKSRADAGSLLHGMAWQLHGMFLDPEDDQPPGRWVTRTAR